MNWKEDYIKKIGCVNVNELEIENAQSLKIQNLPSSLYKFRAATDYAICNLESDTVWLNKPSEYNDPFEFVEYLDFAKIRRYLDLTKREEFIDILTKRFPVPNYTIQQARISNNPIKVISKYQLQTYGTYKEDDMQEFFEITDKIINEVAFNGLTEKIRSLQNSIRVCSFCESPKNLLMWSHYADCHKGFCVEYGTESWTFNDIRRRLLFPVIYQKDFYNSTKHIVYLMEKGIFNALYPVISGSTKSLEWEYENEWRFIFNIDDSVEKQNYPMNCQSKVFLGSRMDKSKRDIILNICRKKGLDAYDAKPSNIRYQMEFELIK